jgi:hypothetical protein
METGIGQPMVFDAVEHGMRPDKSGEENRAALQAMIDVARDGCAVEIRIPAVGEYQIAGEVVVAPTAPASVSIAGSDGQPKLVQTGEGKNVFALGSEDDEAPAGRIAFSNLHIEGRRLPPEASEGIHVADSAAEYRSSTRD